MKMSQREGVFAAVMTVLADRGITFQEGTNITEVLTDEMRKSVHAIVTEGFKTGAIDLDDTPSNREKLASAPKLSAYVSGLISNWFRKDKRFNGNTTYVPKNPGSRAGQGDDQLKALRALKKVHAGTEKEAEIQHFIDKRVAELNAAKTESVKLTPQQISSLPADLVASLGIADEA